MNTDMMKFYKEHERISEWKNSRIEATYTAVPLFALRTKCKPQTNNIKGIGMNIQKL